MKTRHKKFRVPYLSLFVTFTLSLTAMAFWQPWRKSKVLPQSSPRTYAALQTLRVANIVDGTTMKVFVPAASAAERTTTDVVRLYGVEPVTGKTAFGRDYLESLCTPGTDVRFESLGRDKNGALVGIVVLPDGREANFELLKAGALKARFAEDDGSGVRTDYERAQDSARARRVGVWK